MDAFARSPSRHVGSTWRFAKYASELIRAYWTVEEATADACKCAWENDAWVRAMNTNTWSDADNDATYAVYVRTLQGIAYVNEYLRQTASDRLSERGVSSELASRIQSLCALRMELERSTGPPPSARRRQPWLSFSRNPLPSRIELQRC